MFFKCSLNVIYNTVSFYTEKQRRLIYSLHEVFNTPSQLISAILLLMAYSNSGLYLDTINATGVGDDIFVAETENVGLFSIHLDTSGPE